MSIIPSRCSDDFKPDSGLYNHFVDDMVKDLYGLGPGGDHDG